MRRLLLAVGFALVAAFAVSSVAFAQTPTNPHTAYTTTADGCAACHRTHTAQAAGLLKESSTTLCQNCHNGTGATTDVFDGALLSAPGATTNVAGALRGGGFNYARVNGADGSALANTAAGQAATSSHLDAGTMWGAGSSGAGFAFQLNCSSCHSAHPNGNYRLLKASGLAFSGTPIDFAVNAGTNPTTNTYWQMWQGPMGISAGSTAQVSQSASAAWCSGCHTRYAAGAGAGATSSGDSIFNYRHEADGSRAGGYAAKTGAPYAGNFPVTCLQCHLAHGSNVAMGSNSQSVPLPDGAARGADSAMLKIDNRGTCVGCHGTGPTK